MRYAKLKINGKTVQAHRYIYEQAHGPIPPGWHVHHIDGDRLNNAVENLQALAPLEHSRHHNDKHPRVKTCVVCGQDFEPAPTKRQQAQTCSRDCFRVLAARRKGSELGSTKLTEDAVAEIRRRVGSGERQSDLCVEFGVSKGTMSALVNRKTWQHVT